jgi:hypothetical protein
MYLSCLSTAEKNTLTKFVLVRKTSTGSVWAQTTKRSEKMTTIMKRAFRHIKVSPFSRLPVQTQNLFPIKPRAMPVELCYQQSIECLLFYADPYTPELTRFACVRRTPDAFAALVQHVSIDHRRRQVSATQQLLESDGCHSHPPAEWCPRVLPEFAFRASLRPK